jgi:hypothetical protein
MDSYPQNFITIPATERPVLIKPPHIENTEKKSDARKNLVPTPSNEKSALLKPALIKNTEDKSNAATSAQTIQYQANKSNFCPKTLTAGCLAGTGIGFLTSCFFQIPCGIHVIEIIAGCAGFGTCVSGGCAVCCCPTNTEANAVPTNRY